MVQADLSNGEVNHLIKNIPGIIGFLGQKAGQASTPPVPLRQVEVDRILGKVEEIDEFDDTTRYPIYSWRDRESNGRSFQWIYGYYRGSI